MFPFAVILPVNVPTEAVICSNLPAAPEIILISRISVELIPVVGTIFPINVLAVIVPLALILPEDVIWFKTRFEIPVILVLPLPTIFPADIVPLALILPEDVICFKTRFEIPVILVLPSPTIFPFALILDEAVIVDVFMFVKLPEVIDAFATPIKISILAVPSMYKSFHCLPLEPKSYASSLSGSKLELTTLIEAVWIWAKPWTCKLPHDLAIVPKAYVAPTAGLKFESIFPREAESILAIPSIYKSFHCFVDEPKSNLSSKSGIKLEVISAVIATVSLALSPIVNLPVVDNDPDIVTVSPELGVIVLTYNVLICVSFRCLVRYINIIKF